MVSFSSRISPFTSTVILRDRSPRATAVVTSAMFLTCAVRLPAIAFTESVRSFHVPATPGTTACPPSLPSVPTSRATRVTSDANDRSWSTIVLMASFSCRISPRTSTVILRERSPLATAVATSAMFLTWPVRFDGHRVHRVRQILPRSRHTRHQRLAAQLAVRAHLAGHARHLGREHAQLLNHRVHDVRRAQELALQRPPIHVQPDRLRQIALRHGGDRARHFGRWPQQVLDQRVDRHFHLVPRTAPLLEPRALARPALFAHRLPHALQLQRHLFVGRDDVVEGVGDLCLRARPGLGSRDRKIPVPYACAATSPAARRSRIRRRFRSALTAFRSL